jgi:hypothetical protein
MAGRFPFSLPNGWFQVAYAADALEADEAPLHYFGRSLRLRGGASRRAAAVVDAESGRPFPTAVHSGILFAWHHATGASPAWRLPRLPEHGDPGWTPWTRLSWTIASHNQEIAENTADPAHFPVVHGFPGDRRLRLRFERHRFRSLQRWHYPARSGERGEASLEVDWRGLGIGITRNRFSRDFLDTTILGAVTPIDAERVQQRFSVSFRRAGGADPPEALVRATLREIERQMAQDIPIWESKIYRPDPALCEGDGPIARYRRWARQFYSNSPDPEAAQAQRAASRRRA